MLLRLSPHHVLSYLHALMVKTDDGGDDDCIIAISIVLVLGLASTSRFPAVVVAVAPIVIIAIIMLSINHHIITVAIVFAFILSCQQHHDTTMIASFVILTMTNIITILPSIILFMSKVELASLLAICCCRQSPKKPQAKDDIALRWPRLKSLDLYDNDLEGPCQ